MFLKELSEARGVSSREQEVRDLIREYIKPHVDEVFTDSLGNLYGVKGKEKKGPKVMLAAHMEEVGLMITSIEKNGLLRFLPVGGIDPRVLVSKPVFIGKEKVAGVIGAKAIHLQKPEERTQVLGFDDLYIDIGASDEDEAKKLVKIGDVATFTTVFGKLGDLCVGKAFDDRAGCTALVELTKLEFNCPVYFVFTVQEEVGLRGAGPAAYRVNPDFCLVLEGTTASDVAGTDEEGYSTTLGEGPAVSVMDRSVIAHPKVVGRLFRLAEENGIPLQNKRTITGGTDAGVIALSREGVPTATVAVPCRYIHSPVTVMNQSDLEHMIKLTELFVHDIAEKGVEN
ncbi:MAG: M42 family metallopeptidase [Firmicutes bacterium]|nr:M42 family metallopeptidase [Bacillota bacterium]